MHISNRTRRLIAAAIAGIALLGSSAAACSSGSSSTGAQDTQNRLAASEASRFDALVPYPFANTNPSDPLERKNLAARLEQLNSRGDTNYVYIMTFSGQVIGYYVISGKVSSTGSQMTSTQAVVDCGSSGGCTAVDAIGDDGSYGPEEGGQFGVFFFTSAGTLVTTDQPFIESSTPIKIYENVPQLDAAASR